MNEREQNIVAALRRWITGEITRKEEMTLDQQAGDDPFLREALEGYRRFPQANHQAGLERLKQRLPQQNKKNRRIVIAMPYRIAAGVAILLAAGIFWLINPAGTPELAQMEKKEQAAETTAGAARDDADTPARPPVVEEVRPGPTQLDVVPQDQIAEAAEATPPPVSEYKERTIDLEDEAPTAIAQNETTEENDLLVPIPSRKRSEMAVESEENDSGLAAAPKPASPAAKMDASRSSNSNEREQAAAASPPSPRSSDLTLGGVKMEAPGGSRLINGQVLDPAGAPLKGVLVVTPGERVGTVTNDNGQYKILLDDNVKDLQFQRTGFAPQRVSLPDNGDFISVTLGESSATIAQLSETSAQVRNRKKANPQVTGTLSEDNVAQPMVSSRRFERYLQRRLQYPEEALEKGITGEVVLSFSILPNGDLKDIQTLQGPGAGLNQEAIRLLQEGPKWRITNSDDKNITIIYRLKFSL